MYKPEALERAIKEGPEIAIYMMIEDIGGFIWRMRHDMAHGRIPQQDHPAVTREVQTASEEQRRLITEALPRFGVTEPLNSEGRGSDDYWRWYRWWNAWHKGMTDAEWKEVDPIIRFDMTPEQIAKVRPSGSWKVSQDEEAS